MKVKGSAIISTVAYLKETYGDTGFDRVFTKLNKKDQDIIKNNIFPTSWYPFSTLINVTKQIDAEFGFGDLKICRQAGAFSANHDLKTIYKIFYKIGSPQFVISRGSQVFSTYYNQGKLNVIEKGRGFMLLELTDFPELCEVFIQRVSGWMEKVLELSGAVEPKVVVTIRDREGNKVVEFKGKWS